MHRAPALLALLLAALLAGCSSPTIDPADPVGTDAPPSGQGSAVVEAGEPAAGGETGSIAGDVRDVDGAPLPGAVLWLVSLPDQATSDSQGGFLLDGLRPGPYILQAQLAGYVPVATRLDVVAGATTTVHVALARASAPQELVDFWDGRESAVVVDRDFDGNPADVSASQCLVNPSKRFGGLTLRFDDPHQLVWPGTAALDVEVSWDATSYLGDAAAVVWRANYLGDYRISEPVSNGGSYRIAVAPEEADHARQRFTGWDIGLCFKEGDSPDARLHASIGPIHAKMTLVRGHPLPVLQPAPDFWSNGTRQAVIDEKRVLDPLSDPYFVIGPCNPVVKRGASTTAPEAFVFDPKGLLVPPGTTAIEASLNWTYGPSTAQPPLFLTYRTATVAPWAPEDLGTEQRPESVTSEVGHAAYRFAVHADEADGADDPVSAWRFYWNQDKGATDACAGLTVHLAVAAIKG